MRFCDACRARVEDTQSMYQTDCGTKVCSDCAVRRVAPKPRFVDLQKRGIGLNAAQQVQRGML
jgi:hypothetical protein